MVLLLVALGPLELSLTESLSVSITGQHILVSSSPCFDLGLIHDLPGKGISYVTTNKTSDDIVVVSRWPNHREVAWKTPSVIAYHSENPRIRKNHWGYEVTRNMRQYVWTKLLLDSSVELSAYDDPLLQQMYGSDGFLKLPPGKRAQDVVQDFLSGVYSHTIASIERALSPEVFATLPMECWITVPAIWSDGAQYATYQAALGAGFGSRASDSVKIIPEPEAAALWALREHLGLSALDPIRVRQDSRSNLGFYVLICEDRRTCLNL